jgi:Protein of unknown function (DUF3987)
MARDYVADALALKEPVTITQPATEPPRPLTRELWPADPFPIDALGDVLMPAASAIHDRVQAPLGICGHSVLAAATLAVQAHADIELPTGQARPLTSYFLTVAATGERKSAVDAAALAPVRKREAALRERRDVEQQTFENSKAAWDKAREYAIKAAKGDRTQIKAKLDALGPSPVLPRPPLLTCPEPTWEGVTKLLSDGWPSLGIFTAEGGQFIGGHGMSDEAKLRTAAGLSSTWDGEAIKRVRAADGVTVLPGRRLAMHLMAQPDVAGIVLNDRVLADQGLLSRVLITAPDAASGTRLWREPTPDSEAALRRYEAHLLDILERPLPLVAGTHNTLDPRVLPLSREARRLWVGFYDYVEKLVGPGGDLESIRGLANKLPEHAARIAGVLAMVRNIETGEVAGADMQAAIRLAQHCASEALRLSGASRVSNQIRDAQRLLDWLLNKWPDRMISLQDIYQRGPNFLREAAPARRAAEVLIEHGHLVPDEGALVGGKTRREAWRIVRG